jgi:hypothetical protein
LIQGESGTGKELVAQALHYNGPRQRYPFVPVNCAAMPAGLLESELFGHTKGAFSGAQMARRGLFLEASRGTIFLEDIRTLKAGQGVNDYAETMQTRTYTLRNLAMDALMDLIQALKAARAAGRTEEQLAPARDFQRKAQFSLDFIEAENSMGCYAPRPRPSASQLPSGRSASILCRSR